jgi:TPR repeat protein
VAQAEAGESFAQWRLSEAYRNGDYGLSVDPERTKHWLTKSAAQLDFDAALSQANHARLPRLPGGGAQTEAERYFSIEKLQALVQNAHPSRRATLEFLIANKMIRGQGTSVEEAPAREWLKRAALNGSGFATIRLAQAYESINIKARDLVHAYAFYELAGAVYEADRVWRLLDGDEGLTAKQLAQSYAVNVPVGNIDSQHRMALRAVTVSARARADGSFSESSMDAQVHGLGAIEASGYSIKPDQVAVTDYFASNSPPTRYLAFHRSIRGDCAAAHEIAQLISKVETQYPSGRRMTEDQADFVWSAAFLRIAATCLNGTSDEALLAEVNATQQRVMGLVATNNRDQVGLHVAQLQM